MEVEFSELFSLLKTISNQTIVSTYIWITKSKIFNSPDGVFLIVKSLLDFSFLRPNFEFMYSNLASFILKKCSESETLGILYKVFHECEPGFGSSTTIKVLFLVHCFDFVKISYDELINHFFLDNPDCLYASEQYFHMFTLISEFFYKRNRKLFETIYEQFKQTYPQHIPVFELIMKNNFALYNKFKNSGNSIENIIQRDDESLFSRIEGTYIQFSPFSPDICIYERPTIADYAAFCGSTKCIKCYLDKNKKKSRELLRNPSLCYYAIAGGQIDLFNRFEKLGFSTEGSIHVAVMFHQNHFVYENIDRFGGWNSDSERFGSILQSAIMGRNYELIMKCIENNIDLNHIDRTFNSPLIRAIEKKDNISFDLLLTHNQLDLNLRNACGLTPLCYAVSKNYIYAVEKLTQVSHVDVNGSDNDGLTPLHYAASYGYDELLRLLLQREDLEVNTFDEDNQTPIMSAYDMKEFDCLEILASDCRVDLSICDSEGDSIFHKISMSDNINVVKSLLSRKNINLDQKNNNGVFFY